MADDWLEALPGSIPLPWLIARKSDGEVLRANAHMAQLVGKSEDEVVGQPMWSLFHDADEGEELKGLLAADGRVQSHEIRVVDGPSQPFWVSLSVEPITLDGEAALVAGFIDIEDRKQAEETLAEAAAELTDMGAFPEMNPGPVYRVDRSGVVVLANATGRRVFGDQPLEGRSWIELCPGMDETAWARVLDASDTVAIEATIGDQSLVFTHMLGSDGQYVFVYGTDLTDQRTAERALQQSEKMATLGTLAAGVAHEMNNPASAAQRAAEQLRTSLAKLEDGQHQLDRLTLTTEQRRALDEFDRQALVRAAEPSDLDALARSDREAELEGWLETHGLDNAWEMAPDLVDMGHAPASLEELAETLGSESFLTALSWLCRKYSAYSLVAEIRNGASRVAELVSALKSYSYLDRGRMQPVNLSEGLDNTLIILRSKLKRAVRVHREYAHDLPLIEAHGGELNQVWTNLIDNAVDAMNGEGEITLRTYQDDGWAVVEVEDDGPGIPEDVQPNIFDPFFTTKAPGKGTGLGLNTSYNIVVQEHKGERRVDSRPGHTRFEVRLPIRAAREPGPTAKPPDEAT